MPLIIADDADICFRCLFDAGFFATLLLLPPLLLDAASAARYAACASVYAMLRYAMSILRFSLPYADAFFAADADYLLYCQHAIAATLIFAAVIDLDADIFIILFLRRQLMPLCPCCHDILFRHAMMPLIIDAPITLRSPLTPRLPPPMITTS